MQEKRPEVVITPGLLAPVEADQRLFAGGECGGGADQSLFTGGEFEGGDQLGCSVDGPAGW